MRIAHVLPVGVNPYSGLLTSVCSLARALAEDGHDVELWQMSDWPVGADGLLHTAIEGGARPVRLVQAPSFFGGRGIANAVRQREVDLVHLHGVFHVQNVQLARTLERPYVVSPHGGYAPPSLAYHRGRKEVFKRLFELPMLRRASAVCALTSVEATEIRRLGYRDRVTTIPNGVYPPTAPAESDSLRAELGLPSTARLALYVGRIDVRIKRLDWVVDALVDSPDWHFVLVGGNFRRGMERIRELAQRRRVLDRVHIVGPKRGQALGDVLAAADIFLLLSRSEGMPMALLESAAHGVPSLVSEEVERTLPIAAAGGGWLTSRPEISAHLERFRQLDPAERQAMCEAAARFTHGFNWKEIARSYARLYREVLAGAATR